MTLFDTAPYQNLILTGAMGTGKTTIGRSVAQRLKAELYDLENEVLAREGSSAEAIRERFGEARLRTLEAEAIRDLTLRRHAVIVVNGPVVLDDDNRARLLSSGVILCLICTLDEILRRMYVARGAWFHDPANRAVLLSRLKRERRVETLDLPRLDTSRLPTEEVVRSVIQYWVEHARL